VPRPHCLTILAGTDNDYSVTQNGSGAQFDVYFDFSDVVTVDLYLASIQCPMDKVKGRFFTNGGAPAKLAKNHKLLPGVLHGYKVPAADLGGYVPPASP
jgi:hypothetical protein